QLLLGLFLGRGVFRPGHEDVDLAARFDDPGFLLGVIPGLEGAWHGSKPPILKNLPQSSGGSKGLPMSAPGPGCYRARGSFLSEFPDLLAVSQERAMGFEPTTSSLGNYPSNLPKSSITPSLATFYG